MQQSRQNNEIFQPTIPARVMIGVTGHRRLANESILAERVHEIIERIRTRITLSSKTPLAFTILSPLSGVEIGALRPPRHLSLAYSTKDWMVLAFSSVWSLLPRFSPPDLSSLKALRRFMIKSWIEGQVLYHRDTSRRHHRRHIRLEYAGNALLGLTFLAAVSHVLHLGSHECEIWPHQSLFIDHCFLLLFLL